MQNHNVDYVENPYICTYLGQYSINLNLICMYQLLLCVPLPNPYKKLCLYSVRKVYGSELSHIVSYTFIKKFGINSKSNNPFYILIRKDKPIHVSIVTVPINKFIQFSDDWFVIPALFISNKLNQLLLSAYYDNKQFPNMEAVINFLYVHGARLSRAPYSRKNINLPL